MFNVLQTKLSSIHLTSSSDTRGRPGAFAFYRDNLFAEIGDSKDKCSSLLEVQCWKEDETGAAPQSPTQI
jgi:hypothetical protein